MRDRSDLCSTETLLANGAPSPRALDKHPNSVGTPCVRHDKASLVYPAGNCVAISGILICQVCFRMVAVYSRAFKARGAPENKR